VKRGHGGELVSVLVIGPDGSFALGAVDCVDEVVR